MTSRLWGRRAALIAGDGVLEAITSDCSVVELSVDGSHFFVHFAVDRVEHERRRRMAVGAATCTGLLHALWSLPEGIPFDWRALDDRDAKTLKDAGAGWIDSDGSSVTRRFRPGGTIELLTHGHRHLGQAIRRVAHHPPIFRRVAVWGGEELGGTELHSEHLEWARILGVGVVSVDDDGPAVLIRPAPAELGVPSVYRWWMSELAYRNWLYANCAH